MTSTDQLLLQFDLTIIPDSTIAKYMVGNLSSYTQVLIHDTYNHMLISYTYAS